MTKVLVIEDEGVLLEEILEMLDFEGFDAMGVDSGRAGIETARSDHPDVILCDIMMPDVDGYSVLEVLRDDPETAAIPFIFLTAKASRDDQRQGMQLGADDYLTKPFAPDELIDAINARLKRHAAIVSEQQQLLELAQQKLSRMVVEHASNPAMPLEVMQDVATRQIGHLPRQELQTLLGTLNSGRQRMAHLVEQLAYLAKLEHGVLSAETVQQHGVRLQMWPLLAAAVNQVRRIEGRGAGDMIRFIDKVSHEALILVDEAAIKHAFTELIVSMMVYTTDDAEVLVSQWQTDDLVWINVLNRGPNMEHEAWVEIVRRVKNLKQYITGEQGIGLPLVCRIIQAHGGTFELVSDLSVGVQVMISLPTVEAPTFNEGR
jgi:DNA-binding response OmpR family regulator